MKTIFRTYQFELQPTQEQKVLLDKHFGCVRFVFNHFLNERKEQYQSDKKSDNYYKQAATLTELKKKDETAWLKEVNSQSLQFALRCLDTAYVNFFRGNAMFPRFKSRKKKNSFTVPQFARLEYGRFFAPKFKEGIKVNIHREVKGEIGKCTLSKTPTGKYFVSILSEEQYQPKKKTGAVCGIDLGLKDFAITSDGIKFKNNKYTKQYEKDLAKAQKHLSRKTKGSNSFERQRRKTARFHEKITNSRMDNLHKVSHQLVSDYDIIALEDLNVKGMVKNHKLAKHISDASWGTFVRLLEYKADWNDKQIVKINRFYPSSKTCCECGWINQDLNLSIREWTCKNGHVLDRDLNAAKNILKEGLKIISSGTGDYTGGDSNKTLVTKHKSVKPEAHLSLANGQFTIPSRRRVNHVLICGDTGKELCKGCDKTCVNAKKTTFAKAKFYIIERDGKCLRCGKTEGLTIDHVVPLSKGGTNDDDNLQTLCNECNQWKKDFIVDFR